MLVAFLEDRHVRQWEIERRAPLRKAGAEWHVAFAEYLQDAGCALLSDAHPYQKDNAAEYVAWLLGLAVSTSFEDNAANINKGAAAAMAEAGAAVGTAASTEPAEVPAEAVALINELATMCHVSDTARSPLETLQAVHRVIRQRILPAVSALDADAAAAAAAAAASAGAASATAATSAAGGAASSSSSASAAAGGAAAGTGKKRGGSLKAKTSRLDARELTDLRTFPLGFSTGNETVDKAAAILRMLYVTDQRELQDAVNEILVEVQEYTANPKTDASLGVVGR